MAAITTRATAGPGATVKGSPLTNAEVDNNFIELNNDIASRVSASAYNIQGITVALGYTPYDASNPAGYATTTSLNTGLSNKIDKSVIGVANGVVPLDGSNHIPIEYIPAALLGSVIYQGTWNASTNTPALPAPTNKGWYYRVSVSGSTAINGVSDWVAGDWIISNGTAWEKVDNTDQVMSVNGRQGNVTGLAELSGATFTGEVRTRAAAGQGFVSMNSGDGTRTGYVDFRSPAGTKRGHVGYADGAEIQLYTDPGVHYNFNSRPRVAGIEIWDKTNLPNPVSNGADATFNQVWFPDAQRFYPDAGEQQGSLVVSVGSGGSAKYYRFNKNGDFDVLSGTVRVGNNEVWHTGNLPKPVGTYNGPLTDGVLHNMKFGWDGLTVIADIDNGGAVIQLARRGIDETFNSVRSTSGAIGFGTDLNNVIHFDGATYNFTNGKQVSVGNHLYLYENWSRVFIGGVAQGVKVISTGTPSDYPGVQNNDIWFQV